MVKLKSQIVGFDLPELTHPGSFALWWSTCLAEKLPDHELAKRLEAIKSPIASVRAALVLGRSLEVREKARELAGHAISTGDETVRLFGLAIVGILDVKDSYQLGTRDLQSAPNSLILLEQLLDEARSLKVRSALLTEVEARLHRAIAESSLINADYTRARKDFTLAIALGQALNMSIFVYHTRLLLANVSVETGMMPNARQEYQILINDLNAPREVVMNAQMYSAFSLYWSSEDTQMLRLVDKILIESPNPSIGRSYCNALKMFAGVGFDSDITEEDQKRLPNVMRILVEVFSCIWASRQQRGKNKDEKKFLIQARSALDSIIVTNDLNNVVLLFFKGFIHFQLKEYVTSAKLIQDVLKISTIPSLKVMILGLAIEISAAWDGIEIMRLDILTSMMATELLKLSKSARQDMILRFSLLLPLAGAFFSVSPDASLENNGFLIENIIDVTSRPIKVFNTTGFRPIHVTLHTLKRLGVKIEDVADGGGQLEAEEKVLLRSIGMRQHWFLPISPAVLIYLLLKTHEQIIGNGFNTNSSTWRTCALQVIRRFGILPKYQKLPYYVEISKLEKALDKLISGKITVSEFRRYLE